MSNGQLYKKEVFWRDRYEFLLQAGYKLRPRYKPDWSPSWAKNNLTVVDCEDGIALQTSRVIDAVREADGKDVTIKKISKSIHPHEVDIGRYLCSSPLSSDPKNHCCPILDVLQDPQDEDLQLIVMPLFRRYNSPKFQTLGEAVEFIRQAFEGLLFMHEQHVAHRDCMTLNIMMDASPLYPRGFHPQSPVMKPDRSDVAKHCSRTERPVQYYWTDFGLSRRFDPEETSPTELPIWGGDRSVPEFKKNYDAPWNPFHTDVYYVGNLIREDFMKTYSNFDFMDELVMRMVNASPNQRPTMGQVVDDFQDLVSKLSTWRLRSRLVAQKDKPLMNFVKDAHHILYRVPSHLLHRFPAIPKP